MSFKHLTSIFLIIAINGMDATIYDPTQDSLYSYGSTDPFGPLNWPGICQTGKRQSPIEDDKSTNQNNPLPKLTSFGGINQQPVEIKVINNGFGVFFKFVYHPLNAPKIFGGPLLSDLYQFDSFSYHVTREHTSLYTGNDADLELQFLHFNLKYGTLENARDKSDGIAVIAVRYKIFKPATSTLFPIPFMSMIGSVYYPFTEVVQSPGSFSYAQIIGIDTTNIPAHYATSGSLTTPPCYQSARWFVIKNYRKLYSGDLNVFKNIQLWNGATLVSNNRPTQALNGRTITRY